MQKISAIKLIGRSNLENGTAFNKQKAEVIATKILNKIFSNYIAESVIGCQVAIMYLDFVFR